jgi:hypothetical protein
MRALPRAHWSNFACFDRSLGFVKPDGRFRFCAHLLDGGAGKPLLTGRLRVARIPDDVVAPLARLGGACFHDFHERRRPSIETCLS